MYAVSPKTNHLKYISPSIPIFCSSQTLYTEFAHSNVHWTYYVSLVKKNIDFMVIPNKSPISCSSLTMGTLQDLPYITSVIEIQSQKNIQGFLLLRYQVCKLLFSVT